MKSPTSSSDNDYQAQNDADTLQRHAEIVGDPKRHTAAHKKLKAKANTATAAVQTSAAIKKNPPTGAALHQKVKSGLKRAFPDSK